VADYVCTTEDFAAIESIMSTPRDTKFVEIDNALLSNDYLWYLTRDREFLPDDVSQHHMDHNIFASKVLNKNPSGLHHVIGWLDLYLKHDKVRID
jgi:hypothetical protein